MSVLPGIGAPPVGRRVAQLVFTDQADDTGNLTTYTFTARNIGAAATNRIVIAAIWVRGTPSGSVRTFTSVTIGGVTATLITGTDLSVTNFNWSRIAFYAASVPTGTTATVVVTMSGACERASIGLFAAYDVGTTPANVVTVTNASAVPNGTVAPNSTEGGVLFAATQTCDGASSTTAWTNVDGLYDLDVEANGNRYAVGWRLDVDAGTYTISTVKSNTVNGSRLHAFVLPAA